MKKRISMSDKELSKYHELQKVHEKRQTFAQTAIPRAGYTILGLSLRQVKRLSKRLKTEGPAELISRKVRAIAKYLSSRLPLPLFFIH